MTDEFILAVLKRAVPHMIKIIVETDDVTYFFIGEDQPSTWTAFIPGSITRRACEIARYLPIGEYILHG